MVEPGTENTAEPAVLPSAPAPRKETGFFEPYTFLAKTVRTWFIAYGIGMPVLLVGNGDVWKSLMRQHAVVGIILPFLAGVALQVVTAIVFKAAMWYSYLSELGELEEESWHYRAATWITNRYWPEAAVELGTFVLFAWTTLRVLVVIGAA
ncbi:MAG TPA: hypothetical protein VMT19_11515 [Thermoanaerobaculaceae bacterium]|nr:hypothetical protein [Thermoanaerobaculaceae bacterium]